MTTRPEPGTPVNPGRRYRLTEPVGGWNPKKQAQVIVPAGTLGVLVTGDRDERGDFALIVDEPASEFDIVRCPELFATQVELVDG